MIVCDDVLSRFDELRDYADSAPFRDFQSGADGVVYPYICTEVPEWAAEELFLFVEAATDQAPTNGTIFMRASPEGLYATHQAHSDELMGKWTVMVYLNRPEDCRGGTALLRHKATGMDRSPSEHEMIQAWERDTNNAYAWQVVDMAEMKPNSGCVFDSTLMHRAEPVGGFGKTPSDWRVVLTGFFS